jgi:hypothetical protein
LYFGSVRGRRYTRVYRKDLEQKTDFPWTRQEVVYKDTLAQDCFNKLADIARVAHLMTEDERRCEVGRLVFGALRLVDRTADSHADRCPTLPWYQQLEEFIGVTLVKPVPKQIKTLEEKMMHIDAQYAPTLATYAEAYGVEAAFNELKRMVESGKERMTSVHRALARRTKAMNTRTSSKIVA